MLQHNRAGKKWIIKMMENFNQCLSENHSQNIIQFVHKSFVSAVERDAENKLHPFDIHQFSHFFLKYKNSNLTFPYRHVTNIPFKNFPESNWIKNVTEKSFLTKQSQLRLLGAPQHTHSNKNPENYLIFLSYPINCIANWKLIKGNFLV